MTPLTLKGKFFFFSFIFGFIVLLIETGYSIFFEGVQGYVHIFIFMFFIFYTLISVGFVNLHMNGFFIRVIIPVTLDQFIGLIEDQYGGRIKYIEKEKRSNYVGSYILYKYECTEYVFFINGTNNRYEIIIRPKEDRFVKGAVTLGNKIKSSLKEKNGKVSLVSS